MDNLVISITGPTGCGKTTVAKILVKWLGKCVNIDSDHVKHMVEYGFSKKILPDGKERWEYSQWDLVGENIGILANNFVSKGFDVVINGYIGEAGWESLEKQINITHNFLLLPNLETIKNRDENRNEDVVMGLEVVEEHFKEFSSKDRFSNFTLIDSSNETSEETALKIKDLVGR